MRVFVASGSNVFRILAAALLFPIGLWLLLRRPEPTATPRGLTPKRITLLALVVGVVGGIYGIGGGSILGPILAGAGMPLATIAPAALASTLLTSITGALTYALLATTTTGAISPNWPLGIACGLGGLVGGYIGARLQPYLSETFLRVALGLVAVALAVTYVVLVAVEG